MIFNSEITYFILLFHITLDFLIALRARNCVFLFLRVTLKTSPKFPFPSISWRSKESNLISSPSTPTSFVRVSDALVLISLLSSDPTLFELR